MVCCVSCVVGIKSSEAFDVASVAIGDINFMHIPIHMHGKLKFVQTQDLCLLRTKLLGYIYGYTNLCII